MLVPGTVLFLLPQWLTGSSWSGVRLDALGLVGIATLAGGLAVMAVCFRAFMLQGLGTPAPYDPPRLLVTGSLYRYVRNPIYVGVILAALGEAGLFHSLALVIYAGVAWLCCHLFVGLYEEPILRGRFGSEYEAYLRQVPRWLPTRRPRR